MRCKFLQRQGIAACHSYIYEYVIITGTVWEIYRISGAPVVLFVR
jgi:hypothetical protein